MSVLQDKTFQIQTLGCKLNQFDSAVMQGELLSKNYFSCRLISDASIVIVNTCTVTAKADAQSRKLIRRIRRENPNCKIIVTGCYARRNPELLRLLTEVNTVISCSDEEIIKDLQKSLNIEEVEDEQDSPEKDSCFTAHYNGKTRALLKIQDGCNFQCSYCVIPQVRGKSRSIPPEIVRKQITQLIDRGFQEIVLTGVNTGDYGKDLASKTSLLELLKEIVQVIGLGRIRLNSLEPPTITEELIDFLSSADKVSCHLHIPLQSGSDKILGKMHRPYRIKRYSEIIERLHKRIPDIGIGADVIVGFPDETKEDFQETYDFIESSPIHFLHVFPFSKRPNTPASLMADGVHGMVIKERVTLLRQLADELGYAFRKRFEGKVLEMIVLNEKRPDGLYRSLSSNYIPMGVHAEERNINTICNARVLKVSRHDTTGEIKVC